MQFKDIVNRDVVNLSNCESEPIHIPGSIQPHGFLLGLKGSDRKIVYCSANTLDYLGISHEQMLGKRLEDIFPEVVEGTDHLLVNAGKDHFKPYLMECNGGKFSVSVHASEDISVLEFEPFPENDLSLPDLYSQTSNFVHYLEKSAGLQELCQLITEETRKIIEYDRVMVYRFDKDYNGEVFAESKRDDLESFLGLNYPHTDIPAQARELYMRNLLRLISDIDYTPVPIFKLDDQTSDILDLGMASLRSVSPMHVMYLNNMGVSATLTISLIHDQKLWGLIACHHYSPRVIPLYTRLAAQLQGNFLTSQIRVREVEEVHKLSLGIQHSLEVLLARIVLVTYNNYELLLEDDSLLSLVNAGGVVIVLNGEIIQRGKVPDEQNIRDLATWLGNTARSGTYHTSNLTEDYPGASNMTDVASGVLYHTLAQSSDNCIIWFRPEVVQTVNWAGDPNKSIIKDVNGLYPRNSFELWKEIRKSNSAIWQEPELLAASNFAYALQKQRYLLHLTEEEIKYKKLNAKLQKTNSELENMNWISTHDLKEPLRKIQIFGSMILDNEEHELSEPVSSSIHKMRQSANRMQTLLNDIMSYSRLNDKRDAFADISLDEVIETLKSELKEEIDASGAVIVKGGLPEIKGIRFQVDQLFLNLIRNSLKFKRDGVQPAIDIYAETVEGLSTPDDEWIDMPFHKISVKDNGIGFSAEYNSSLFEVFKRLHNYDKYKGNGIGLAISRKIMENHEGYIFAEGKENQGAVFHVYFPVEQVV